MNSAALSHSVSFARTCSGPLSVWHPPGGAASSTPMQAATGRETGGAQLHEGGSLRPQRGIKRFGLVFADQPLV
jgi:hypothetical protein